ncbi:MAG: LptF/LptG family permease [Trueperaceae bacterium]
MPSTLPHPELGILGGVLNRLSRYLLNETVWLYFLGVLAFCLLLSVDRMVSWAGFFVDRNASLLQVGQIMLYSAPEFLRLAMPASIAFSVLLATGRLAKDSELKAAYSSGVPPVKLLFAMLLFGLCISALTLLNNSFLLPRGEQNKDRIVDNIYNGTTLPPAEMQRDMAFRTSNGNIFYAGRVQRNADMARTETSLEGILVRQPDGTTLTAPSGVWDSSNNTWTLTSVQRIDPEGKDSTESELVLPFNVPPASQQLTDDEYLTLGDLWQRVRDNRAVGGDVEGALYTFHKTIADALSALVFAFIACVLGLELHGRSAGFAWTIVLILAFWILWTLSQSLFEQQVLSPLAAAYFSILVMGTLGATLAWWRLR